MTVKRDDFDTQADWDEYIAGLKSVPKMSAEQLAWSKRIPGLLDGKYKVGEPKQYIEEKRRKGTPGLCAGDYVVKDAPFDPPEDGIKITETLTVEPHLAHLPKYDARRYGAIPDEAARRKGVPVYSGFDCYFPDAIAKVAELSRVGNDQHNPGTPLHWDRSKSGDELDSLKRHLLDHASGRMLDTDGVWHLTKVAWRAMAALQKECERQDKNTRIEAQQKSDDEFDAEFLA